MLTRVFSFTFLRKVLIALLGGVVVLVLLSFVFWNEIQAATDRALLAGIPRFEEAVSAALGAPVKLTRIKPEWSAARPGLHLEGLVVQSPISQAPLLRPALQIDDLRLEVDLGRSLVAGGLRFGSAKLRGVKFELVETADKGWRVSGLQERSDKNQGSSEWLVSSFHAEVEGLEAGLRHIEGEPGQLRFARAEATLSSGLSGKVDVRWNIADLSINDSVWLVKAQSWDQISGQWSSKRDDLSQWQLESLKASFGKSSLSSEVRYSFSSSSSYQSSPVRIWAELKAVDLPVLRDRLPRVVLPSSLRDWFETAIEAGHADQLELLLDGTPSGWASLKGVTLSARTRDLRLHPLQGWPSLTQGSGTFRLENGAVDFELAQAQMDGAKISHAVGRIEGLAGEATASLLKLGTSVDAPAQSVLKFLTTGPFHDRTEGWVESAFPTAPLKLRIELSVPLRDSGGKKASEKLELSASVESGAFQHPDTEIEAKGLRGKVAYVDGSVFWKGLEGEVDGMKFTADGEQKGAQTRMTLQSSLSAEKLRQAAWVKKAPTLLFALEPWSGSSKISAEVKGEWSDTGDFDLQGNGDLTGLTSKLPEPWAKVASDVVATEVHAHRHASRWEKIELSMKQPAHAEAHVLRTAGTTKERWAVDLTSSVPVDGSAWWSFYQGWSKASAETKAPTSPLEFRVTFKSPELKLKDWRFHGVDLESEGDRAKSKTLVRSEEAKGSLEKLPDLIRADFSKLVLMSPPDSTNTASPSARPGAAPSPEPISLKNWPSLSLRFADLQIGERKWGTVRLDAHQRLERYVLEQFSSLSPELEVKADRGEVTYSPLHTEIQGTVLLKKEARYRFESKDRSKPPIQLFNDQGYALFRAQWSGGPDQFSWAKAEASLNGYFCEGRFEGVRSFVGSLFNLLSLRFEDTRKQMMRFNKATFDLRVIDGQILTRYIRALFGSNFVKLEGKTGVENGKLDLEGFVTPFVKNLPEPSEKISGGPRCSPPVENPDEDFEWEEEPKVAVTHSFQVKGSWDDPDISHRWF